MSLQHIANVADDLSKRARDLQPLLVAALQVCPATGPVHDALQAMKCSIAGIKMEGIKLASLAATGRMTGDLPATRALAPVEALPLFQIPAHHERTPTADELNGVHATDRRMAAANDHTLLDP